MFSRRWIVSIFISLGALGGCGSGGSDASENSPPNIASQGFTGDEDSVIEGQVVASDPGDTLTFFVDGEPAHGRLVQFESSGAFRYEPIPDFSGFDAFIVRAVDSAGANVVTVIRLNVTPSNDAPIASDDVLSVSDANALEILANDTDPDADPLTVELLGVPFVGVASVTAENTVHVQLPLGFKGFTRFRYRISDPAGLSSEATALVFVGIEPFKIVYAGTEGVFVNDLLSTRRVSAPETTPVSQIESMQVAASGKALAYMLREADGNLHLKYVHLDNPGVARALEPPAPDPVRRIYRYQVSSSGRHVVAEYFGSDSAASYNSTLLFDAEGAGGLTQLGQPSRSEYWGSIARFNADGTRVYYLAYASLNCTDPVCADGHALYRTDLATGATTRVSPVRGHFEAVTDYRFSRDETRLLQHVPSRSVVVFRYSNVYMVDVADPDSQVLLSSIPGRQVQTYSASMSPDGSHAFVAIGAAYPNLPLILLSLRLVQMTPSFSFAEVGLSPLASETDITGVTMRADSQAMLLGFRSVLYEVKFDDPGNPVSVSAPVLANERIGSGRYSPDGDRIFYLRQDTLTGRQDLELTRRDAIGTSIPLTAPGDQVSSYLLEPSGHVALVVGASGGDWPYGLVNADVPQSILEVSGPGAVAGAPVALVRR